MQEAVDYLETRYGRSNEDLLVQDIENARRKTRIRKPARAIELFKTMIGYYLVKTLIEYRATGKTGLPVPKKYKWLNLGGQLVTMEQLDGLLNKVETGMINSWQEVHEAYLDFARDYSRLKLQHALACFVQISGKKKFTRNKMKAILPHALETSKWIYQQIIRSKQKDFDNPFRRMMYRNQEEMDTVLGTLEDIPFLDEARKAHEKFVRDIRRLKKEIGG